MHRLLKRQIKKTVGENYAKDTKSQQFLDLVSDYYTEVDKEKSLLENALVVNSEELTQLNEKLQGMAFYDALTGLTNRKLFEQELQLTIKRLNRHKRNIAVLFFDLDNFKTINDTLGHDVGDELLKQFGTIVNSRIREGDILARWGGDEFVLLLDELTNLDDCTIIIKDIQKAFINPIKILEHKVKISFSIGINLYEDGQNSAQMIKNADMAMYLAKQAGRNQYAFYSSEVGEQAIVELKLNTELENAVKNREFVVFYQPQIDIKSGEIVGAEALVRWEHPTDGLVAPDKFIPLAEEKGYIIEIGKQVLEQACLDMNQWLKSGYSIENISVNLSVRQIHDKDFIQTVKDIIAKSKLDANYLELEITETMVMKEYEHSFKILDELRSLGITISIDDFGTGYSSLAYLKKLPIHKIKIDKSFIDEIEHDENDVEITKAIIAMSHSLGLEVLAEGVEKESQLKILKKLNCERYQGYYFSKPVPAEEFQKLLHLI